MRKIAAILFISILLFNLGGYRIVIAAVQTTADQQLESRIDNSEYDESQLMEIRVALNMPYQERYTEFERHYGEINVDGKVYTYVKKKIEGDVLVLKCIINQTRQELKQLNSEQAKNNSSQEHTPGGKQTVSFAKVFSGDYDDKSGSLIIDFTTTTKSLYVSVYSSGLSDVLLKTPHQPPRLC